LFDFETICKIYFLNYYIYKVKFSTIYVNKFPLSKIIWKKNISVYKKLIFQINKESIRKINITGIYLYWHVIVEKSSAINF